MKNKELRTKVFQSPEIAKKICTRMGWEPEGDSETFLVAVPEEDNELFNFIFEYFM